jgi:hypothetical protein
MVPEFSEQPQHAHGNPDDEMDYIPLTSLARRSLQAWYAKGFALMAFIESAWTGDQETGRGLFRLEQVGARPSGRLWCGTNLKLDLTRNSPFSYPQTVIRYLQISSLFLGPVEILRPELMPKM